MNYRILRSVRTKATLFAATALAGLASPALAQTTAPAPQRTAPPADQAPVDPSAATVEDVVVTGYRASLQSQAADKRRNVNFTDSIFAEDIGKFPDQNLAEALQRVPGVQIERDVSGEGTSVNIRGLGSAFTIVTLNGAPIQTASDSNIDALNQGRGLDLDLFPTELFKQLTVSKTPRASDIEGGIAGNVDLKVVRPFDRPGPQFSWQVKNTYQEVADEWAPRGGFFASNTWDTPFGEFGLLGGLAYSSRSYRTESLGTLGYTTFNLGTRCSVNTRGCNSQTFLGTSANPTFGYGGGATIPTTVPVGTGYGLVNGAPLTVCGGATGGTSGLSCQALSYAAIPRLVRAEQTVGERIRQSAIVTAEWRPLDNLRFNLDFIAAKGSNDFERTSLSLAVRSTSNNVPIGVVVNDRNVVTHATFANAQLLSENRPYREDSDLYSTTLGMEWEVNDWIKVDGQVNYNTSEWTRSQNTYLFRTPLGRGNSVVYDLVEGQAMPRLTLNFDPNLVTAYEWQEMRIQPSTRDISQTGARFNVDFGDDEFKISVGGSYDQFKRKIQTWDTSSCLNTGAGCSPTSANPSIYPTLLNVIPNSQVRNFLTPWRHPQLYTNASYDIGFNNGWALPNYALLDAALNIDYYENQIDPVTRLNTLNPRIVNEDTWGGYIEMNGKSQFRERDVRYNAGVHVVKTDQEIAGIVIDPTLGRGVQYFTNDYLEYLPSFNVAIDLTDKLLFRMAASRSMTRPAPGDLAPGQSLNVSADTLTRGNPALKPFFSNNYDLGLEYYFNRRATLALNVWTKEVSGFTQVLRSRARFDQLGLDPTRLTTAQRDALLVLGGGDINAATINLDQRQNTSELVKLRGVELTALIPLDFITRGLGINANYTHIEQESEGAPASGPGTSALGSGVTGLSPNTYNFTVYYERGQFSARASYNYRDTYISSLGPQNNFPGDTYRRGSKTLDASLTYRLPRNITVSLEAQNLLEEEQLFYINDDDSLPYSANAAGRQFVIGVRGRF
jgi:TonB-dependent receptor